MPPPGHLGETFIGPGCVMDQRIHALQEIYQTVPPAGSDPVGATGQLVVRNVGHASRAFPFDPVSERVSPVTEAEGADLPASRGELPGLVLMDRFEPGLRGRGNREVLPGHLTLEDVPETTRLAGSVNPDP